ncbi:MAG: efflux RND transporter periplasmic adaptor subunit [Hymenobacter sp.]
MNRLSFLLLFLLAACSAKQAPETTTPAAKPATAAEEARPDEIVLTAAQQRAAGIEIGSFERENMTTDVQATGSIEVPPENRASISAVMGGYVQTVNVLPGQPVRAGAVLATLRSPDFLKLQQDYLQSRARVTFLAQELERQRVLDAEDVGAKRKLQQARADYTSELAAVRAGAAQLQLLGLSVKRINTGFIASSVPLITPVGGTVKAVNINPSQYVGPQDKLVEVVNNNDLHLELKVFEQDIARVKVGQAILFTVQNRGSEEQFHARVFLVGKSFDDDARVVRVHAHLEPERDDLLPGQFVSARIQTGVARQRTLPETGLVQAGPISYAFVQVKQGADGRATFRRFKVRTGPVQGGRVAVTPLDPLPDSTRLVRRGAYFLAAELGKGQDTGE